MWHRIGTHKWEPIWYPKRVTDLVPKNGNRFGTQKWEPIRYPKMVTDLVPQNENRFGSHKWEPIWYQKNVTDLVPTNGNRIGTTKWEPIWYTKAGTDLVTKNWNWLGVPKLFFISTSYRFDVRNCEPISISCLLQICQQVDSNWLQKRAQVWFQRLAQLRLHRRPPNWYRVVGPPLLRRRHIFNTRRWHRCGSRETA